MNVYENNIMRQQLAQQLPQSAPSGIAMSMDNQMSLRDRTANLTPDPARMEALKRLLGGL